MTERNQYIQSEVDEFDAKVLESFRKHLKVSVVRNDDGYVTEVNVTFADERIEHTITI